MRFFIFDAFDETKHEVSEARCLAILGRTLFDQLCMSGSLSCGTTIYEAVADA